MGSVRHFTFAALVCLATIGLVAAPQGPHIATIVPSAGRSGDVVTITGGGFGALNATVTVGGRTATVLTASGDRLTFIVPPGLGPGVAAVTLTNPGRRAATIAFQVLGSGLLPGDPSTPAIQAVFDLPGVAVSKDDIDGAVIMSRLHIRVNGDATVGQVNAALTRVGGEIASMSRGLPMLTIRVPRQPNLAALQALADLLRTSAGIGFAGLARTSATDELPFSDTKAFDSQLLPAGFPAAWNARRLVVNDAGGCRTNRVPVLVADSFIRPAPAVQGLGAETTTFATEVPHVQVVPDGSTVPDPQEHGDTVTLLIGAMFNGTGRTGANPFADCLDIIAVQIDDLGEFDQIDRITQNFPAGKFILNYSRSWPKACADGDAIVPCRPEHFGAQIPDANDRAEHAFWWKVRSRSRWDDFLVASSAGNLRDKELAQLYPVLARSTTNSFINAATLPDPLFGFFAHPSAWTPTNAAFPDLKADADEMQRLIGAVELLGLQTTANAPNTLKVGSTSNVEDVGQLSMSGFSNTGHDVSAVGQDVLSIHALPIEGTSFSAPQVAGLASYLWLLSPHLRSSPASLTRETIIANARTTANAFAVIDAYATVLSLDEVGPLAPASDPIRHAILDANGDARFDDLDLTAYRTALVGPTGTPLEPNLRDYGRHDLNGDGFTGGATRTSRFDLERSGSARFGAASYSNIEIAIEGLTAAFDERAVTDLQVLCYYAYSGLYEGTESGRRQILQGLCVKPTISVTPATVTLAPGATQQFIATVRGLADTQVLWTASGGTITAGGLFTAGSSPGSSTIRATSVTDPSVVGQATVTIPGGVESGVLISVGGPGIPAGSIQVVASGVGFQSVRPLSQMQIALDELTRAVQGVQINSLWMSIQEPVAISFTAGDVRQLTIHGVCGATISATVGAIRPHPTNPGANGNGNVNLVVCGSTTVTMQSAENVRIDGAKAGPISLTGDIRVRLTIANTFDTSITASGGLASLDATNNGNIVLRTGDITGIASIANSTMAGLGGYHIGDIGSDLLITNNKGISNEDAEEFARARIVLGRVTIIGNVR